MLFNEMEKVHPYRKDKEMKKLFVVFLMALMLTGCGEPEIEEIKKPASQQELYTYDEWKEWKEVSTFEDVATTFEESEIKASPEYWEELEYNSRENEW